MTRLLPVDLSAALLAPGANLEPCRRSAAGGMTSLSGVAMALARLLDSCAGRLALRHAVLVQPRAAVSRAVSPARLGGDALLASNVPGRSPPPSSVRWRAPNAASTAETNYGPLNNNILIHWYTRSDIVQLCTRYCGTPEAAATGRYAGR
eukprot:3738062-Pleurochrysis_carterae.AAC.1